MAIKEIEEYYNHLGSYQDAENYYSTMTYPAFCIMADRVGYLSNYTLPKYFDQIAELLGFTPPYTQYTIDWVEIAVKQASWYPDRYNFSKNYSNIKFKETNEISFNSNIYINGEIEFIKDNIPSTNSCNIIYNKALGANVYNNFRFRKTPGLCIGKDTNNDIILLQSCYSKKIESSGTGSYHPVYRYLETDNYNLWGAMYEYYQSHPTTKPIKIQDHESIPGYYLFSGGQPFLPNYQLTGRYSGVLTGFYCLEKNTQIFKPNSSTVDVQPKAPVNNYPPFLPANSSDMSNSLISNINFWYFGQEIYGIPNSKLTYKENPYV